MISVATAMLCKEQGITITGICAVYELIVAQKVSVSFLSEYNGESTHAFHKVYCTEIMKLLIYCNNYVNVHFH